jgi:phosphoglycerate dehydrogenase-like enzyme
MSIDVLCLRPEADFERVGALPPEDLSVAYRKPDEAAVPDLLRQARALVIPAVGPKIPSEWFAGTKLKLIQITGAGLDRLDAAAVKQFGIPVANVPAGSNGAVAEFAVSAAIVLLRRLTWADAEIRAGNYQPFRSRMIADSLLGLENIQVGVVGLGVIGMAVAQAFHKMGSRICYYDPAPKSPRVAEAMGAKSVALLELLSTSEVVTLHVPLIEATIGLIGEKELGVMKAGAVLIHASRGGVVDESALAQRLSSGYLGGAAVDVYSTEPPSPTNPLLQLQGDGARRLLLTPHVAGVTKQSTAFLCRSAWNNIKRVLIENQEPLDRAY